VRFTTFPLELRRAPDTGSSTVTGYGAVFGVPDLAGDIVRKGAFAVSLAAHKAAGTMPALLWQHDPAKPAGRWTEVSEDELGLRVRGVLNLASATGREAAAHLSAGDLSGLSIGFQVAEDGAEYDARTGLRILKAVELWEVSIVTFPAQPKARTTRSAPETVRELEAGLRDLGLSAKQAKAVAARGWSAMLSETPEPDPETEAAARRLAAQIRAATRQMKEPQT
jgi:HK97 family phage prohead protease